VAAADRLGVELVVGSNRAQAMAPVMGDRAVVLDLSDPHAAAEEIVGLSGRTPLDAVVAVDDQGVVAAAEAGRRLGLRVSPPDAVAATRDKAEIRRRLAAAGVRQPAHELLGPGDDATEAVERLGPPCVLKPLPLSASRGVIRVDEPAEAPAVASRIRTILADAGEDAGAPLLVERFVAGAEVAVEGLLQGGALDVLAVFDKPDPLDGPYFEETIYVTPSRQPADVQRSVAQLVGDAARALGLTEGPIHAEARIPAGEAPVLLELAARSIGGLCSRSLRFGAGISLEEVILRHALGLPVEPEREAAAAGVMMLPIPRAGRLTAVGGRDEAAAVEGIVGLEITVPVGRQVQPLPEGDRYLGFLFASGDTPASVEHALRAAAAALDITISPAPG
jgi:biotin carboxylase